MCCRVPINFSNFKSEQELHSVILICHISVVVNYVSTTTTDFPQRIYGVLS
jgi:hypothetical protein